jgi:hypothetical protein
VALSRHPDRNSLLNSVLAQLGKLRPWTLHFALTYLAALDPRPSVGAPAVVAPEW